MKICSKCKKQFEDNIAFCAFDGQQLDTSQNEDDLEGRLIDYKYQIHEKIARGGTGSVYRGTHLQLHMPIAIKVMHRDAIQDITAIERFRREAYASMEIRHPNAIAVMDFGVTPDNLVYVVMELLKGQTLRQRLKDNRFLSFTDVNEIMQQICAAVSVAHQYKIIHRDLKPENIFIDQSREQEVIKVLDFGIAKFKGNMGDEQGLQLTRAGIVVGTPYYMSPEQCYGKEVDARSDVYSLGIMLYELLAGRLPFLGRSHTAVAVKQAREAPRPIYEVRTNVPAVLNAVVMHALAKKPDDRPADLRTFANELDAAMKAVTESEFRKVFLEASEEDLEAAILLTADPKKLAEQTRRSRKKKHTSNLTDASLLQAPTEELASTVNTQLDESVIYGLPTEIDEARLEDQSGIDINPDQSTQECQASFQQIGTETSMLLQIILGDLEINATVDQVFLSELKTAVDQLRSVIYRLQKITNN